MTQQEKFQKEFAELVVLNAPEAILDMHSVCKDWKIDCQIYSKNVHYIYHFHSLSKHLKSQCQEYKCYALCRRCNQWREEEKHIICLTTGLPNIIHNCCLKKMIEGELDIDCDYCNDICIF